MTSRIWSELKWLLAAVGLVLAAVFLRRGGRSDEAVDADRRAAEARKGEIDARADLEVGEAAAERDMRRSGGLVDRLRGALDRAREMRRGAD